jgi:hypothetical protein
MDLPSLFIIAREEKHQSSVTMGEDIEVPLKVVAMHYQKKNCYRNTFSNI